MRHSQRFLALVEEAKGHVREVTVEETRSRLASGDPVTLLDIREDHEWDAGHAAAAQHLGKGVIERDIEEAIPEPEAEIILYCGGGYRSILAAAALQKMGYTCVYSMAGGWRAWNEAGLPTEVPSGGGETG